MFPIRGLRMRIYSSTCQNDMKGGWVPTYSYKWPTNRWLVTGVITPKWSEQILLITGFYKAHLVGCRKDSLENPEALQIGLDDTLAALNIFFKTFGAHMIHVWSLV